MGFRVSLYAVFGCSREDVLRDLGLESTGEFEDFPESPIVGAMTPAGAYLLYVNDRKQFGEDLIRPLQAKVVSCNVNETTMVSSAAEREHGRERWSVYHDSSQGIGHIDATGEVPDSFEAIRDEQIQRQADEGDADHVFDVPVNLFVAVGGIRYDQDLESDVEQPWEVLQLRSAGRSVNEKQAADEAASEGTTTQATPIASSGLWSWRGILAILGGFTAMTIGVMLYQGLFMMLPMYLRDPEGFQRMMELSSSPQDLKAAYDAGTIPKLGTVGLSLSLVMDALCAALGGYVATRIARRPSLTHAIILAVLMTTYSIIYALTSEVEAILPPWVPWTRALLCIPLGIVAGGWLYHQGGADNAARSS